MALTFDTVTSAFVASTGSSASFSHTVGSGSNRVAYVFAAVFNSGDLLAGGSCTFGGVSAGSPVHALTSGRILYVWRVINPTPGANTVVVNATGTVAMHVHVVSASDVDQSTPNGTIVSSGGSTVASPVSNTVTLSTGGTALDIVARDLASETLTPDGSHTALIDNFQQAGRTSRMSYKAGSGSTTMSWTLPSTGRTMHVVIPLNEAAGGGATAVTLTGPTSGTNGVASSNFTVGADGAITGDVVVTPSDGGDGGTFTPTTVTINSGSPTGTFTYTPASTGAKTISVTNDGGLANPSSISYTSNAPGDTTNPSAPGTPAFSAVTKNSATVTYTAATDDTAVTGYERRFDGGGVVDLGNVLTFDMTGQTPGATVTVEVRAYDAAGNRGAWASADVTFLIYGVDFDDPALDLELGNVSGSLVDLGMLAATSVRVTIQDPDTSAVVHEATVSTSAAGVLPRVQHAALDGAPYVVLLQTTEVAPLSRSVASIIIQATAP